MNRKAKGSRNERKARDILKGIGYSLVVKSGASLGLFDLVALSVEYDYALLVQIKTNRGPSRAEMDLLKAFQVPKFCKKELWVFKDYQRKPEILEL
jgi:Holliday junction resolvase